MTGESKQFEVLYNGAIESPALEHRKSELMFKQRKGEPLFKI